MPNVRFKHIVSCSSEDLKNPAENLLKQESYYKWKTALKGENQAVVVLQLEKATHIHSIDIGNNGSAFVEVLTGRSTWDANEEYKVLLVASSFMSPAESKSGRNTMSVRMFGKDSLNKAITDEKWDRIKVVCTQPYNKDEPYGLSFIQLHSPPEEDKKMDQDNVTADTLKFKTRIGKFTLKDESDEEDDIQVGSFFAKRFQKTTTTTPMMSSAASARDASSKILSGLASSPASSSCSKTMTHSTTFTPKRDYSTTRKPESTEMTSLSEQRSNSFAKKIQSEASKRKNEDNESDSTNKTSSSLKKNCSQVASTKAKESTMPPSKKVKVAEKPRKNRKRPFHQLLRKVVFALSGFKNPERGNLRDKAVAMGAEYRPDWGPGCTHLICAFKNTPKFNQVKGKGIIVSQKWIIDCAKRKERFPIKDYRMDDGGSSSDFDSDIEDENPLPQVPDEHPKKETAQSVGKEDCDVTKQDAGLEQKSPDIDAEPGPSHVRQEDSGNDEEYDTEDELTKARLAMEDANDEDPYGGSTDNESDSEAAKPEAKPTGENPVEAKLSDDELPELPDYFKEKHFLLYGDFNPKDQRLLNRYITAYNGVVENYMNDNVSFVISNANWDVNFDEALQDNPSLEFIRPKWIFKCHEMHQFLPFDKYKIEKST
eukprot:gene11119-12289_t